MMIRKNSTGFIKWWRRKTLNKKQPNKIPQPKDKRNCIAFALFTWKKKGVSVDDRGEGAYDATQK
jgi:hypothetical protein